MARLLLTVVRSSLHKSFIILLSEVSIIVYKAVKRTDVENDKFLHFKLSPGTYFIDNFNAKIKVEILQQRLETTSN